MRIGLAAITSSHLIAVVREILEVELLGDVLAEAGDLPGLLAQRVADCAQLSRGRRHVEVAALGVCNAALIEDRFGRTTLGAAGVVPERQVVGHHLRVGIACLVASLTA